MGVLVQRGLAQPGTGFSPDFVIRDELSKESAGYGSCSSGSRRMLRIVALMLAGMLAACSSGHSGESAAAPPDRDAGPTTSVELGVPGGPDGLDFAPLDTDAELDLHTFGQGGTHVLLGVRTVGFGIRAYVGFTLTDETGGHEIDAPPPVRPQLFACDDAGSVCDLVPVTIMTGGLFGPDETRSGLPVVIHVDAHTDAGESGEDEREVLISGAELAQ